MKILHITETAKGGVSSVINAITENTNYNNVVLAPKRHSEYIITDSLHLFRGDRGLISIINMIISSIYCVLCEKPKVIHLHSSLSLLLSPVLFFLSLFMGFKVCYQPHGVAYDYQNDKSKIYRYITRLVEKFLVKFIDKIISISEYEKIILIKNHGVSKVSRIYNPLTVSVPKTESINNNDYFLFVGRFDRQKGLDELLRYWSIYRQEKLVIIGESVVDSNMEVKELYNIDFIKWLDPDSLINYYKNAKALIMPSRWEGFGLVATEAMACGAPVIGSNRGALPELIDDGINGYIFDFDNFDESLNEVVNKFMATDRSLLSKNAVSSSSRFSVEKYVDKLMREYSN